MARKTPKLSVRSKVASAFLRRHFKAEIEAAVLWFGAAEVRKIVSRTAAKKT